MNTARFYPRKTRFTPDSAACASRDFSAHSATTSATELRRSHRKRDRNRRNSCALAPDSPQRRKQPKLPKADAPTLAQHLPDTFRLPAVAPDHILSLAIAYLTRSSHLP